MRMCGFARLVMLLAMAVVAPAMMHADSILLSSQSGTNYAYDFYSPGGSISFAAGSTITLTGLTGVTGVTLSQYGSYAGTATFTSTSVTYTLSSAQSYSSSSAVDLGLFTVASSSSNMGALRYALQETTGTQTGTIAATGSGATGAAATPEPSSLVLMATGAAVLWGFARRQWGRGPEATAELRAAV